MSYSLNIHIWLDEKDTSKNLKYLSALSCVADFKHLIIKTNETISLFSKIRLFDKPHSKIADLDFQVDEEEWIFSFLKERWKQDLHASIESAYPVQRYDEESDSLVWSAYPLDINFYGVNYGMQGYHYDRYGHIEMSFNNVNAFSIPPRLIEKTRNISNLGKETGKWLLMIAQLSQNYDIIIDLVRCLVKKTNPLHILVCTESDVNPFVAHTIYHKNLSDFVVDLIRIAQLHEKGGVYFSDLGDKPPDNYLPPWKFSSNYGYLRGNFGNESTISFIEKIQPLVNFVLTHQEQIKLRDSAVKKCFELFWDMKSEELENGYLISASEAPFSYIEEPYFQLYSVIKDCNRLIK